MANQASNANKELKPNRLSGLILAGGKSKRMGKDKGLLNYHGTPQVAYLFKMMQPFFDELYVSVNKNQTKTYHEFPLIIDSDDSEGPLGGIISAFEKYPDSGWLILAVDMPFIIKYDIEVLISARDTGFGATCFSVNNQNVPEPLISIWETSIYPSLDLFYRNNGRSPKEFLMRQYIKLIDPPDPVRLQNINNIEDYQKAKSRINSHR